MKKLCTLAGAGPFLSPVGWYTLPSSVLDGSFLYWVTASQMPWWGWDVFSLTKACMFPGFSMFRSYPSPTLSSQARLPCSPHSQPSSTQCDCPAPATPSSLFLGCLKQSSCDPGGLPCWCPSSRVTVLHYLLSIVWKLWVPSLVHQFQVEE